MKHITIGRDHNKGKIALVECKKNDCLKNVTIKNECFLLIVLTQGTLTFQVDGAPITALAPCFLCFDEQCEPRFLSKSRAKYFSIYFHPQFLNANMIFELLRSNTYEDIASLHDLFLMAPFLHGHHLIPICDSYIEKIETSCMRMGEELRIQRDWY